MDDVVVWLTLNLAYNGKVLAQMDWIFRSLSASSASRENDQSICPSVSVRVCVQLGLSGT